MKFFLNVILGYVIANGFNLKKQFIKCNTDKTIFFFSIHFFFINSHNIA